jgi:multicomponent Na+:H+ antiporter subunit C
VSANLTLMGVAALLIATGVYLMMERSLTRVLVGVLLAGNGVNVVFLVASGPAGAAPFVGTNPADRISDPLPQAMVLTAIVITLGLTAFLLTMAYRSFQLNGHDEVADDVEDRQIVRLAEADLASDSFDENDRSLPSEDDSDPDPAVEGSDEQDAETEVETVQQRRAGADADERRDSAEEATDEIIGQGTGGTGS